eukprot:PhF_6_TR5953/c0_g1_i1/m.8602
MDLTTEQHFWYATRSDRNALLVLFFTLNIDPTDELGNIFCPEHFMSHDILECVLFYFTARSTLVSRVHRNFSHHKICLAAFYGDVARLTSKSALTAVPETEFFGKGLSVIHIAALGGSIDTMKYCLEHGWTSDGKEMNCRTASKTTVTQFAARGGSVECLQFCLERGGGSLTERDLYGATALHYAAQSGCINTMEYCIQQGGCDPKVLTLNGATVTHYAALGGSVA